MGQKMEEMKIVHILFSFMNGGIENLLVDIMNHWEKKDHILLCVVNQEINPDLVKKIKFQDNRKFVCLNRKPGGAKIKYIRQLERILQEFHPDIIHCHSNASFRFCCLLKPFHPKTQYILTIHSTRLYSKFGKFDCLLHRLLLNQVFVISKSVEQEVRERNPKLRKVVLVYNGVDCEKFQKRKNQKEKGKGQFKRIFCIARLNPAHKGQDILLQAIGLLSQKRQDFFCFFVGAPPVEQPEISRQLKRMGEQLGINNRVFFLGDRGDVPRLLTQADLLILPSRYEGFGIVLIEAMAAGVPVLGSDIEGIREIVGNNQFGYLFQKENEEDLAEKINYLLDADTSKVVEKADIYVHSHFCIKVMTEIMRKLYIEG